MQKTLSSLLRSGLNFFELQLFLMLACFPILIYWGLPISWISPISNLIFSPFLLLFLSLSSIIFFLSCLCLPAAPFIWLLERATSSWLIVLSYGSSQWLSSFFQPSLATTTFLVITILGIHYTLHKHSQKVRILTLLGMLCLLSISFYLLEPTARELTIKGMHGKLVVMKKDGTTTITDEKTYSKNPETFVNFKVMPQLRKALGSATITYYSIPCPTPTACSIARQLLKHTTIETIELPYWQEDNRSLNWHFIQLKKEAALCGTKIRRIKNY